MKRRRILPIILIVSVVSILVLGAIPATLSATPIDIKPGSNPNSINLGSKGVVPVAILGNSKYSVDIVDPSSVKFQGVSAVKWSFEDVNGDGYTDIVFHFKIQELIGLTQNSIEGILTGENFDGGTWKSTDSVNIVPKK
jgi:hypothetical protein